jgi:hypothetical protein
VARRRSNPNTSYNKRTAKSIGKWTARKPAEVYELETTQGTCPKGHVLPHKTNQGLCTPLYCAGSIKQTDRPSGSQQKRKRTQLVGELKKMRDAGAAELKAEGVTDVASLDAQAEQLMKLQAARGRQLARQRFLKVPEGLTGADAEEWSQKRAVELLPKAIGELDYQLTLGDDAQRRDAARDVLDINGMRRREGVSAGGATIILNLKTELPWAQKVQQVIDGKHAESLPVLVEGPRVGADGAAAEPSQGARPDPRLQKMRKAGSKS